MARIKGVWVLFWGWWRCEKYWGIWGTAPGAPGDPESAGTRDVRILVCVCVWV